MTADFPKIMIPLFEGDTPNSDASAVRWQIPDAIGAGANANQHALQFQLEIPNALIAEALQRKGVPREKQELIWKRDKANAHVSSLNEDLLVPKPSAIALGYPPMEGKIKQSVFTAINDYLRKAFGPACKTGTVIGLGIGGLIADCRTFQEALERPINVSITIIEDATHKGMADHAAALFQEAGYGVENRLGVALHSEKIAQYPQTLTEVALGLNNTVYNALGIKEGVRVAPRTDGTSPNV